MEDRHETLRLSVQATLAEAIRTLRVERDVVALGGVAVGVVEIAWFSDSFEVRLELRGGWEQRKSFLVRMTERNWRWTAVDDLGNRYAECGGQGGPALFAVRFEPALDPRAHTVAVRLVEADKVLGDASIPVQGGAA